MTRLEFVPTEPPYCVDIVSEQNGIIKHSEFFRDARDGHYWMMHCRLLDCYAAVMHDANGLYVGGVYHPRS
jgi:hypothetical protein